MTGSGVSFTVPLLRLVSKIATQGKSRRTGHRGPVSLSRALGTRRAGSCQHSDRSERAQGVDPLPFPPSSLLCDLFGEAPSPICLSETPTRSTRDALSRMGRENEGAEILELDEGRRSEPEGPRGGEREGPIE